MAVINLRVGSVVSLSRYPVKSMMGEQLNAVDVTEQGFLGDRRYAIIDSVTGNVASAKNLRKFPGLFDCLSNYVEAPKIGAPLPPIRVTLPDGNTITSADSGIADILSTLFGHEVCLSAPLGHSSMDIENPTDIQGIALPGATPGLPLPSYTFFDTAPLLILTTASLEYLRGKYPEGRFEVRRFRPNIVLESTDNTSGFVENEWIGKTLSIGKDVRLRVANPCSRCVMTTLPQGDLPRDPEILRAIAQYTPKLNFGKHGELGANLGVYCVVEHGGRIKRGDGVWLN